jgi:hypothetical protein
MSDFFQKILLDKLTARKHIAGLPVEQKLTLMEKMRDRSVLISQNPLRAGKPPTTPVVVVSGNAVVLFVRGAHLESSMLRASRQLQGQSSTVQISVT